MGDVCLACGGAVGFCDFAWNIDDFRLLGGASRDLSLDRLCVVYGTQRDLCDTDIDRAGGTVGDSVIGYLLRDATSRSTGSGEASAAAIETIILPSSFSSPPDDTDTYQSSGRSATRAWRASTLRLASSSLSHGFSPGCISAAAASPSASSRRKERRHTPGWCE